MGGVTIAQNDRSTSMQPKPPSPSRVEMTQLVLPEHTNALGTIFGGQIMAWIDTAAAVCSFRHCRQMCVTVSMDALQFISPVKLGQIVILQANVNFTGKTSLEIGVKVTAEDPLTGDKTHTSSAYLTFVAVDSSGKPIEVPPILPETEQEKKWFEEGKKRRAQRLANKAA
jgi:acyl-CoA hydrolase